MKEIKAIIQPFMLEKVLQALVEVEALPGVTVSQVIGWGESRGAEIEEPVHEAGHAFARKTRLEMVVPDHLATLIIKTITKTARTGRPGDGKIFVHNIVEAVKIRTGQRGAKAI